MKNILLKLSLHLLFPLSTQAQTISNLEEALNNPTIVKELDLSNQELETLDNDIIKLIDLEELNLDSNRLSSNSFPKDFSQLKKLKKISVRHNAFRQLPKEILDLPQLESLDYSANICLDSLRFPPKLSVLNLSNNLFRSGRILVNIWKLEHLEILNLSCNSN